MLTPKRRATGPPLSSHAVALLLEAAAQCEADGLPAAGIKCLLAVLAADPLPEVLVRGSLQLADLYLRHTHNVEDARQLMHKLVRGEGLKFWEGWMRVESDAWCTLAHVSTPLSRASPSPSQILFQHSQPERVETRCECLSRLAQCALISGDAGEALEWLRKGQAALASGAAYL